MSSHEGTSVSRLLSVGSEGSAGQFISLSLVNVFGFFKSCIEIFLISLLLVPVFL